MAQCYVIRNWEKHFENNRTRELKRLDWVPIPNSMDGDGYTELVDHANGAAHFGVWIALVEVASRCDPRGTLSRDGATGVKPHDFGSLSRITRLPEDILRQAIPRLLSIGWLELQVITTNDVVKTSQDDATIPHDVAAKSQDVALNGMEWNGMENIPPRAADAPEPNKPKTSPKPRKEPTGIHAEFIRVFCSQWEAKYGIAYPFSGGKDADHIRCLRKHLAEDAARFAQVVKAYLADAEKFVVDDRHSLGLLLSRLRRYIVSAAPSVRKGSYATGAL